MSIDTIVFNALRSAKCSRVCWCLPPRPPAYSIRIGVNPAQVVDSRTAPHRSLRGALGVRGVGSSNLPSRPYLKGRVYAVCLHCCDLAKFYTWGSVNLIKKVGEFFRAHGLVRGRYLPCRARRRGLRGPPRAPFGPLGDGVLFLKMRLLTFLRKPRTAGPPGKAAERFSRPLSHDAENK